jgi:DNA-binding transcriptional ArsR family regulator
MKHFRVDDSFFRASAQDIDGRLVAAKLIEIAHYLCVPAADRMPPDALEKALASPSRPCLVGNAEEELRRRRLRQQYLPQGLSEDRIWTMLLDLFVSHHRGQKVSTKAACIATEAPERTAMRWLEQIEREGLIERSGCRDDKRVRYVSLTRKGLEAMQAILSGYNEEPR